MTTAPGSRLVEADALFSSHWHRVAGLRPRLRAQVRMRLHLQRGAHWHVLVNGYGDEVHRLNGAAYAFVGRCDGRTTVDAVWEALLEQAPDEALSQDEVMRLLAQLHEAQLIEFDVPADVEDVFGRQAARTRRRRWAAVNPMAFKMTLLDPSRWITRLDGVAHALFSRTGLACWCALVLVALFVGLPHASALQAHALQLALSTSGVTLAWLVYPLLKAVHELSHGLALQRYGITPGRAGVDLLLLTPVPFVDASGADGLRHRHQRAVVSAAGIAAELALAAVALLLWTQVEPGHVRDLALCTMLIGAVSTLLVNGNPLMRYDGYFVACDLLDLRNLSVRSARWWGQLLRHRLLGVAPAAPFECLAGERGWLIAYAPLALLCRLLLGAGAVLWVASFSSLLGAMVGGLVGWSLLGRPLLNTLPLLRTAAPARAWWRLAAIVAVPALLLGWPLPHHLVVRGVVWPAEQSQLRTGVDGVMSQWLARDGQPVQAGSPVVQLLDDELQTANAVLRAQVAELDVQLFEAQATAPTEAPALREKLAYSRAELQRNEERLDALLLHAPVGGTLVLQQQDELVGRYQRRGSLLGYVNDGRAAVLRLAVPQEDASLLEGRHSAHAAEVGVRLASDAATVLPGRVLRQTPGAVARLPAAALGEKAGGDIATDPRDNDGLVAVAPVVVLDVELPAAAPTHMGERAWVRLDLQPSSLASRFSRSARQLFLSRFNPSN